MADTVVFDEFVRDRAPSLLRTAYLLTRDHGHAEDLLQTALVRSWGAWRRIDGNPEPYVRKILVNTYASWRGRRWHGERPSAMLPEPPGASPHVAVDDRDEVWRALERLPRQQRAVLVLRYFEDLPEAQIADALGIPAGSVKSSAARALATLRLDESLRPDLLDVPPAPSVERIAAIRGRIARQRRRRVATVAAACVAVLALILAYALGSHFSLHGAHEPIGPGAGSYQDGYRIVAQASGSADRPISVAWTPGSLDTQIFIDCSLPVVPGGPTWIATAYVGDLPISNTFECPTGASVHGGAPAPDAALDTAGVRVGVPVEVTLRVTMDGGPTDAIPPAGAVSLAIGEAATFDEYPLPPRPPVLPPLERPTPGQDNVLTVFGPATPATAAIQSATGQVSADIWAQTPGFVTVSVAGGSSQTLKFWEYGEHELISFDLTRLTGPATMTVTAEHMTGGWFVAVRPER